ncbi:unnamed protein product, partial [marine sediment metagenome]
MQKPKTILIAFLIMAASFMSAAEAKSSAVLLQEAVYAEQIEGDLDAAMGIYRKIIEKRSAKEAHIAQAMYRLGMCHLK